MNLFHVQRVAAEALGYFPPKGPLQDYISQNKTEGCTAINVSFGLLDQDKDRSHSTSKANVSRLIELGCL